MMIIVVIWFQLSFSLTLSPAQAKSHLLKLNNNLRIGNEKVVSKRFDGFGAISTTKQLTTVLLWWSKCTNKALHKRHRTIFSPINILHNVSHWRMFLNC